MVPAEKAEQRPAKAKHDITIELQGSFIPAGAYTNKVEMSDAIIGTHEHERRRTDPKSRAPKLHPIDEVLLCEEESVLSSEHLTEEHERRKSRESSEGSELEKPGQRSARGKRPAVKRSDTSTRRLDFMSGSQDGSYAIRAGMAMTNERALAVLDRIEKKLRGECSDPGSNCHTLTLNSSARSGRLARAGCNLQCGRSGPAPYLRGYRSREPVAGRVV